MVRKKIKEKSIKNMEMDIKSEDLRRALKASSLLSCAEIIACGCSAGIIPMQQKCERFMLLRKNTGKMGIYRNCKVR